MPMPRRVGTSSGRFHMLDFRPSNRRRAAAAPGYLERTIPSAGTTVQDALVWSHIGIHRIHISDITALPVSIPSPRRRSIKVFPLPTSYFTISLNMDSTTNSTRVRACLGGPLWMIFAAKDTYIFIIFYSLYTQFISNFVPFH